DRRIGTKAKLVRPPWEGGPPSHIRLSQQPLPIRFQGDCLCRQRSVRNKSIMQAFSPPRLKIRRSARRWSARILRAVRGHPARSYAVATAPSTDPLRLRPPIIPHNVVSLPIVVVAEQRKHFVRRLPFVQRSDQRLHDRD